MRLALAIVLLAASTVAAQPAPPPPPPASQPPVEAYGWRIMIADAIFVTAAVIGIHDFVQGWTQADTSPDYPSDDGGGTNLAPLSIVGVVGYLVVPAVIHGTRRNKRGAGASFMARFWLPIGGMLGGAALMRTRDGSDGEEVAAGAALGAGTAMLIDWLGLAQIEKRTSAYTPTVTPVRDGGMTFGIAGSF